MPDVRIARKDFIKGLGVAAAACVAGPIRAATGRSSLGAKEKTMTAADLPFKARPAAKIVARPDAGV